MVSNTNYGVVTLYCWYTTPMITNLGFDIINDGKNIDRSQLTFQVRPHL